MFTAALPPQQTRLDVRVVIGVLLSMASASQAAAGGWSDCEAVTAVTSEPVASTILITLTPGIAGCAPQGVTGAIEFVVGQDGLVADNLDSILASSLSALATGRRVQIGYDSSSANCYSTSLSIGGYLGDC